MNPTCFTDRLRLGAPVSQDDLKAIGALCGQQTTVAAKKYLMRDRDCPQAFPVMLKGWAARYQILRNGSRQITGVLLPGDACYFDTYPSETAIEEIVTLSPCCVAYVRYEDLDRLLESRPGIAHALRQYARLENAVLSSWVINIGRRDALERIAHFISEAHARLSAIGAAFRGRFHFPLTQEDFADVVGLTPVHINRKLQQLRREGIISLRSKEMTIIDRRSLEQIAGFESDYLYPHAKEQSALKIAV